MESDNLTNSNHNRYQISGKNRLIVLAIVFVFIIILAGCGIYLHKKAPKNALSGVGSSCSSKTTCKSGICVNQKCSEGKKDDACRSYTDCGKGLYCKKDVCANVADSSAYFNKVTISRVKPASAANQEEAVAETDLFSAADRMKIDITGVKPDVEAVYYVELARSDNREVALTTKHLPEKNFDGKDTSIDVDLTKTIPAKYDLNIFVGGELVYTAPISVERKK